jgi:hypothetical protein
MTKKELIELIISINHGITREFLAEFSIRELTDYLRQLGRLDARAPEEGNSPATAVAAT